MNTCIRTYHKPAPNAPLEEWEDEENRLMRSVREYVEHGYAGLDQVMGITADKTQWYLMASRPYAVDMYISCVFLQLFCLLLWKYWFQQNRMYSSSTRRIFKYLII